MERRGLAVPVDGVVSLILFAVLVGFGVFGVDQGRDVLSNRRSVDAGEAAVAAARKEVLALTTISAASTDADIERILAGASKEFRKQFEDQATSFRKALSDAQVTSTGKIASAGLVRSSDTTAEVLVAASGTVQNKTSKAAQPRNYRLRVSLVKVDGKWLVSGMDFVS